MEKKQRVRGILICCSALLILVVWALIRKSWKPIISGCGVFSILLYFIFADRKGGS